MEQFQLFSHDSDFSDGLDSDSEANSDGTDIILDLQSKFFS